jgi:hypothetical protein
VKTVSARGFRYLPSVETIFYAFDEKIGRVEADAETGRRGDAEI